MNRFVTRASDDLKEECHSAIRHDNMNISRLRVDAQHVENAGVKRNIKDAKRARSFDGCSSKGRLEIHDKPRFQKKVSNQVLSKFP